MRNIKEGCPSRQEVAPHTTTKPQATFYCFAAHITSKEPQCQQNHTSTA